MARLIPRVTIDEIALKPERDVARALIEQLPDECLVYHSYPWLRPERHDRTGKVTLREGETDFVVVLPSHGLLVLEVKGGEIIYDEQHRRWLRKLDSGSVKDIRDPFEQARRNTHFLKDRIAEMGFGGTKQLPFAYGYAVVFPDCEYQGPTPPGAEPAIILSANDLPYLDRRIPNVLKKWIPKAEPPRLEEKTLEAIQRAISPAFQLLPVLFRQIEEQEERLFRMTGEQMRLLDFLANRERAAIEGVAGSGKTLLARSQAQRFADINKRTLLVCYNKALAEWLRDSIPESYADRITVLHFHALCSEWCRKARVTFAPPSGDKDNFWKEEAAWLLVEAIEKLADQFDAVVVDEGQDFHAEWWLPIEQINAGEEQGVLYIFYDPAQNLFVDQDQSLPDLGTPFSLPTNCRNTRRIANTCGEIIGQEVPTRDDAPDGVEPRFVGSKSRGQERKAIQAVLDEWIRGGRLKMSQVAILSPNRYRNSVVAGITGARVPITEDLRDWADGRGVLFSSIRAFKGLEADAVILVDVGEPDKSPAFTRSDYYVACSRGKHLLVVIQQDK